MGHTNDHLNTIRGKIAADDTVLAEARERLALVRDIAMDFPGALRTYPSGSLAQFTVNHPVTDGDGGLVLNRVHYPDLGPEGGGETPNDISDELCALLGPELRQVYPKARCGKSKRGPKITFGEPINAATATTVPPGESETIEFTAPDPGEYPFVCTLHPGMEGTLVVEEG